MKFKCDLYTSNQVYGREFGPHSENRPVATDRKVLRLLRLPKSVERFDLAFTMLTLTTHTPLPTAYQVEHHLLVLEMIVPKTHTPERNKNAQNICNRCQRRPVEIVRA
jgi:hypothetical protein